MSDNQKYRLVIGALSVSGLLLIFLFQGFNVAGLLGIRENPSLFIVNRTIRFLLNDLLAIVLIYSIFQERKYLVFAVVVQLIGLFFILIPYFIIKIKFPSYNGPLISFLHRLVLNPTLLLILIPAFFYQKRINQV